MSFKRTPTVTALIFLSWVALLFGMAYPFWAGLFPKEWRVVAVTMFLFIAFSFLLRLLANIGQLIFEIKSFLYVNLTHISSGFSSHNSSVASSIEMMRNDIRALSGDLNDLSVSFHSGLEKARADIDPFHECFRTFSGDIRSLKDSCADLQPALDKIGKEVDDMNRGIIEIRRFFSSVGKRLDLKG